MPCFNERAEDRVEFGFQHTGIHLRLHRQAGANCHLAPLTFSMSGESTTSSFGYSARNRSVPVVR